MSLLTKDNPRYKVGPSDTPCDHPYVVKGSNIYMYPHVNGTTLNAHCYRLPFFFSSKITLRAVFSDKKDDLCIYSSNSPEYGRHAVSHKKRWHIPLFFSSSCTTVNSAIKMH